MPKTDCTPVWVIKIGSSLIAGDSHDQTFFESISQQIHFLMKKKIQVALVSSGAIALGMTTLKWQQRPTEIHKLQVAAAVGQSSLLHGYEQFTSKIGVHCGQVLLTHAVISDRKRYLNACSALKEMLRMKILPVINENDTISTHEIRFGDNDNLAAMVCNMLNAQKLVLLTDQDGLFSSDPRINPDAKLIDEIHIDNPDLEKMAGGSGHFGRGGMISKIQAARRAPTTQTLITNGNRSDALTAIYHDRCIATSFKTSPVLMPARKRWIADHMHIDGRLYLDPGAIEQILVHGRSLLPVGVVDVSGSFQRGALVGCYAKDGNQVARGLTNYSSQEARRILRKPSSLIADSLGYAYEPELIHRDNLVVNI